MIEHGVTQAALRTHPAAGDLDGSVRNPGHRSWILGEFGKPRMIGMLTDGADLERRRSAGGAQLSHRDRGGGIRQLRCDQRRTAAAEHRSQCGRNGVARTHRIDRAIGLYSGDFVDLDAVGDHHATIAASDEDWRASAKGEALRVATRGGKRRCRRVSRITVNPARGLVDIEFEHRARRDQRGVAGIDQEQSARMACDQRGERGRGHFTLESRRHLLVEHDRAAGAGNHVEPRHQCAHLRRVGGAAEIHA